MRLTLFDRYIAGTMFKATVMTLVVLVTLLIFFGLIDEMDDVGRGDYRLADRTAQPCLLAAPAGRETGGARFREGPDRGHRGQ